VRLVACPGCHIQYDVSTVAEARFRCSCGLVVENVEALGRDATARRCGSCGAAIEPKVRECPYCRAALVHDATALRLICPECFSRNDEAYRYCIHCGVEFRPQPVPGTTPEISCPACGEPLHVQSIGGVPVRECSRCAGLWVPGEHFDSLVKRAMETARAHPVRGLGILPQRAAQVSESKVAYRRCPVCEQPMHRKNFGRRSGVILDWCGEHGTWLDAQELEQVAQFVLTGGLEESERRRAEEAAQAAAAASQPVRPVEMDAWVLAQSVLGSRPGRRGKRSFEATVGYELGSSVGAFLRGLLGK
jgi:Zn-finger nucleic acid-binding protein